MTLLQLLTDQPEIDRKRGDIACRNCRRQRFPEQRVHDGAATHAAHVVIDAVHHQLHDADRDDFSQPYGLQGEREIELSSAHQGKYRESKAADIGKHCAQSHRCVRVQAQRHADDQADELTDHAAGQAMQRGMRGGFEGRASLR